MKADYYLTKIRHLRRIACLSMDSGESCDHALHLNLLAKEHSNFMEAQAHHDLRGKAGALANVVTVACGYALDAGTAQMMDMNRVMILCERAAERDRINLHGAFALVLNSNVTKLCTREQIAKTQDKYAELGILVEFRESGDDLWSCFAANSVGGIAKGKWLRGSGYTEPTWYERSMWML